MAKKVTYFLLEVVHDEKYNAQGVQASFEGRQGCIELSVKDTTDTYDEYQRESIHTYIGFDM